MPRDNLIDRRHVVSRADAADVAVPLGQVVATWHKREQKAELQFPCFTTSHIFLILRLKRGP
jgi:hypothetical protein